MHAERHVFFFFFCYDPATTEFYTLSVHDALPILSLSLFANETSDNAGGYYDYRTLGSRMGLEYETENWTFSASASGSESKYDVRPVLDSNWMPTGKVFSRQSWETELSIERKVSEDWRLYAQWNEGADQSNDPSYEYEATAISA